MIPRSELDAAKDRLRLPELWRILNLPGEPGKSCRVPYREDRKASGSIRADGRQFHDFASGEDFDAVEFLARVQGITNGQAVRQFVELANGQVYEPVYNREESKPREQAKPNLKALRLGNFREFRLVADQRHWSLKAIQIAQDMGVLRFAPVCRLPSWIVTDSSERCAEGRRLDGKLYPAVKQLPERKAHTIRHSNKSWPVGILPAPEYQRSFDAICIAEGGPDLLSLIHFALKQGRLGILPVAILGRGACLHGLHPDSLEFFKGNRVRIFPHHDDDGVSYENALVWAKQLQQVNCDIDFFVFDGLIKTNGSAIKDLNDCVEIAPEHAGRLEELFP